MQTDGGVVRQTDVVKQFCLFSQNIATEILTAKWTDHFTIPSCLDNNIAPVINFVFIKVPDEKT